MPFIFQLKPYKVFLKNNIPIIGNWRRGFLLEILYWKGEKKFNIEKHLLSEVASLEGLSMEACCDMMKVNQKSIDELVVLIENFDYQQDMSFRKFLKHISIKTPVNASMEYAIESIFLALIIKKISLDNDKLMDNNKEVINQFYQWINNDSKIFLEDNFLKQDQYLSLPINGLMTWDELKTMIVSNDWHYLENLTKQGFTHIKVKFPPYKEISNNIMISTGIKHYLIKIKEKRIKLRIDLNNQWTKLELVRFFGELKNICPFLLEVLEFIEDPFSTNHGFEDMNEVYNELQIPFAIDEIGREMLSSLTLENINKFILKIKSFPCIKYIILKPSNTGGWFKCIYLIQMIKSISKNVIISSSFEVSHGFIYTYLMAHWMKQTYEKKTPMGLDTIKYIDYLNQNHLSKRQFKPSREARSSIIDLNDFFSVSDGELKINLTKTLNKIQKPL